MYLSIEKSQKVLILLGKRANESQSKNVYVWGENDSRLIKSPQGL